MGQIKKIKGLIDSFEKLPDGNFKESVKEDIEQIKEIYAEVHTLKKEIAILDKKLPPNCS